MYTQPVRLLVGAGSKRRDGFIHMDRDADHGPDLIWNEKTLPMFPDASVDELEVHKLTRLPGRQVQNALKEWRRVLKPDGLLTLVTVDVEACAALIHQNPNPQDVQRAIDTLYGGVNGSPRERARSGWTEATLTRALIEAGFSSARVSSRCRDLLTMTVVAQASTPSAPSRSERDKSIGLRISSSPLSMLLDPSATSQRSGS